MWRHGDVLIASIDGLPEGAKPRSDTILARGEQTGHMHRLETPGNAELWELNGQLYIKVVADTVRIVHEEHKPITVPRGIYRVWQQREYTPERVRPVFD
jgi:hypothetical protein